MRVRLMKKFLILLICGLFAACSQESKTANLLNNDSAKAAIDSIANINPATEYTNLWIEPDVGEEPLLYLLNHATKSIDIVIYQLDDERIQSALVDLAKKNVAIKIIYSNQAKYGDSLQKFCDANTQISCRRSSGPNGGEFVSNPSTGFPYTHEKALIIDNKQVVLMTGNLVNNSSINYFTEDRDLTVVTNNSKDVQTLINEFSVDWDNAISQGTVFPKVEAGSRLFFSPSYNVSDPANSYTVISDLINQATQSIDIYSERFLDKRIAELLNTKAKSGTKVRVITAVKEFPAFDKVVQVMVMPGGYPLFFHAKGLIIDKKIATVMSVNYTNLSIDRNREAGIVLTDSKNVTKLEAVFNDDWKKLNSYR